MNKVLSNHVSIEDIAVLLNESEQLENEAKLKKVKATALLQSYHGSEFETLLKAKPEPFGVVNVMDGDFKVYATVDKKVTWDQDILAKLYESFDKPDEYIKVSFEVSEAKYKAWPSNIKERFIKARTVKPGNMKITLEKKNA